MKTDDMNSKTNKELVQEVVTQLYEAALKKCHDEQIPLLTANVLILRDHFASLTVLVGKLTDIVSDLQTKDTSKLVRDLVWKIAERK